MGLQRRILARPVGPDNPNGAAGARGNEGLKSYVRAVIYVRKQDASESYWWG